MIAYTITKSSFLSLKGTSRVEEIQVRLSIKAIKLGKIIVNLMVFKLLLIQFAQSIEYRMLIYLNKDKLLEYCIRYEFEFMVLLSSLKLTVCF